MAFILRLFACHSGTNHIHKGHPQPKFPVKEGECLGCYSENSITIHGHKGPYCSDCFRNDIKCRLGEAGTKANLEKCPHPECKQQIVEADLIQVGSPQVIITKFKNFVTKDKAGWVACPMCGETRELPNGEMPADTKTTCAHCSSVYCCACSVSWHANKTCEEYREKEKKKNEEEAQEILQVARLRGWRRCPECRVFIEKNNGCNHMQHPKCGTHFCYECGVRLNTDGSSEFYKANPAAPPVHHFANNGCRNLGANIRNRDEDYYY